MAKQHVNMVSDANELRKHAIKKMIINVLVSQEDAYKKLFLANVRRKVYTACISTSHSKPLIKLSYSGTLKSSI